MAMPGLATRASEQKIASATKIYPTADVIILTGTTAIATIVPPNTGGVSNSVVILVATGGDISLVATGNIAVAATLTNKVAKMLVYSVSQGKWY